MYILNKRKKWIIPVLSLSLLSSMPFAQTRVASADQIETEYLDTSITKTVVPFQNSTTKAHIASEAAVTASASAVTTAPAITATSAAITATSQAVTATSQAIIPSSASMASSSSIRVSKSPSSTFKSFNTTILQNTSDILKLKNSDEDTTVTFKSTDSSILSVEELSDDSCRYTGINAGQASIIAKVTHKNSFLIFNSTETYDIPITVSPRAVSIKAVKTEMQLGLKKKAKFKVTLRPSITIEVPIYQTSNSKIVSIDENGMMRGNSTGTAYVTASISNGKTAKCKIIVKKRVDNDD